MDLSRPPYDCSGSSFRLRMNACTPPQRLRARARARRTHIAHRADREPALDRVRARARVLAARERHDVRAGLAQAQALRTRRDLQALEAPVRVVQVRQVCARAVSWVRV
jgi:cell division septum initiation protein DivIVA